MSKRLVVGRVLIGLGSLNVLVGAGLHLFAGYPRLSAVLSASNLTPLFANAMRSVFLMVGMAWVTIAIVALIAAFTHTRIGRLLVLLCALSLLAEIPVWVSLMGWFIGNEMIALSAALITLGGILFQPYSKS